MTVNGSDVTVHDAASVQNEAPSRPKRVPAIVRLQRASLHWFAYSPLASFGSRLFVRLLKGVPLLSLSIVVWRLRRVWLLLRKMERSATLFVFRTSFELWALVEVGFWFYFKWKKRTLEMRRAYQPSVLWKSSGERLASLQKVLASVEHIHTGDGFVQKIAAKQKPPGSQTKKAMMQWRQTVSSAIGALYKSPSVETFLRYQSKQAMPASLQSESQQNPSAASSALTKRQRMSASPSVENLLQCWSSDVSSATPNMQEGPALQALKHLELCSWFTMTKPTVQICTDISQVRRGNIQEWVLSYWFDGADNIHAQELTEEEVHEVHQLTDEVIQWAGLSLPWNELGSDLQQDKNPHLRCFRLRNDPFPAVHRPFFCYVSTAFLMPLVGNRALASLGFRPYRSGSMEYWFKPRQASSFPKSGRPRRPSAPHLEAEPIVFIHGIGIGPTMCLRFLQQMVKVMGDENPIFLVDVAAISMRFVDEVPSSREVASNIANMLEVWGFNQAHFIAHSFGNFIFAWMLRYERSYIERATCIDPACFLTLKMFKEVYEIQQIRKDSAMTTMEMGIKYFVATELFICNFCCRCFFWEESQLDIRDLEGVPVLVVLESDDLIVQVHSVRRLVLAEQQRRVRKAKSMAETCSLDLLWLEGQPHAGFLADAETNREINTSLHKFHLKRVRSDSTKPTQT